MYPRGIQPGHIHVVEQQNRGDEAGEDQYPLGVDRAAHLHLAFDVDHLPLTDVHRGGDPRRLAEHVVAHAEYRQGVSECVDCEAAINPERLEAGAQALEKSGEWRPEDSLK